MFNGIIPKALAEINVFPTEEVFKAHENQFVRLNIAPALNIAEEYYPRLCLGANKKGSGCECIVVIESDPIFGDSGEQAIIKMNLILQEFINRLNLPKNFECYFTLDNPGGDLRLMMHVRAPLIKESMYETMSEVYNFVIVTLYFIIEKERESFEVYDFGGSGSNFVKFYPAEYGRDGHMQIVEA